MRSLSKLFIISLIFSVLACSDKQQQSKEDAQRHISSAKVYQDQGQYRAAIIEAKNAIQQQPESHEPYLALAKIYNEIGAFSAVQDLLAPRVEKLPQVATELASSYFLSKKYLTAINTVNTYPALEAEAKLTQLWIAAMANINLGDKDGYEAALKNYREAGGSQAQIKYIETNYLLSKGEIEKARTHLADVLTAEPENTDALLLAANINIFLRNLDEAEKHLTKGLAGLKNSDIMSRQKASIMTLLTETLIQQGRTSEAYTYQKLLAEANPESNAAQQRLNEAMEYYQQGKFEESEAILRELREQFPDDKNTATLLGLVEYQKGADRQASDLFDEFVDPETVTPTVLQAAALVKFRSNQVDDAINLLKKAADSQPNNHVVLATYGLALLDRDPKSAEGAKVLEKSLALEPNQQRIRIALANRYLQLGQKEQAIAQLQKAYSEQPNDFFIQQSYFKALLGNDQKQKLQEEIAAFKVANPESPRGYFFAGLMQMQEKQYAQAEQEFEKAVSLKDNNEKHLAFAGLAQLYELQAQPQKAVAAWEQALRAEPGMVAGYGRWLAQMRQLKRDEEVLDFLLQQEANSDRWEPSLVLAQVLATQNNIAEAIKHIETALERSKQSINVKQLAANLYRLQGVQLRSQKDLTGARESLMRAVKMFPENASFLGNLIETEIAANNIGEAQKLLDQFVRLPENEAERLFLQGLIRFAEGKNEEGIGLYLQAWDLKPMESVAEQIFGYYQKAGEKAKAEEFLAKWIAKNPESRTASLMMAVNAQGKNNNEEALSWYEKSVELNPNMPAALNNLAWMYYERKDPRALEYAKRAYELAPNVAPILDTYGWILVERGDLQQGIALLQRAAELEPDNKEIQEHLKEALSR